MIQVKQQVSISPKQVFARNAWLGPGRFAQRVLLTYDARLQNLELLRQHELPPGNIAQVDWLLPGFINAHCHLEYSWLKDHLPRGDVPFGEWMQAIIKVRPVTAEQQHLKTSAMNTAAKELLQSGCIAAFDSTTDGASAAVFERSGICHFAFVEVLGLSRERAQPIWENAMRLAKKDDGSSDAAPRYYLNPHAPYSVGGWLRDQLRNARLHSGIGHGWHLGETADEEELFLSGTGSIAEFLTRNDMPFPYEDVPHCSASGFLQREGLLGNCTIGFHGNTLSDEELRHFRAPRALVHCPGTHRWFQREPVPLKRWLAAGVNVCLGTDSLASSDTLSMLEITRMTLEDNPNLTADEVLQMACSNPARIQNIELNSRGILHPNGGGPADFIALESPVKGDDWDAVLRCADTKVEQVWISGVERLGPGAGV